MINFRRLAFLCLASEFLALGTAAAFFDVNQARDSSARALGMGGAYTGLAEGASGGAWNPAGLAWEERISLEAGAGSLAGGGSVGVLRGALPRIQGAAFGFGWSGFRRSGTEPGGEGRIGAEAALHLDAGKRVAAGAGLRYLWGTAQGQSWGARALDLGLLAKLAVPTGRPLALGLSLGNLGTVSRSSSGLEIKEAAAINAGLAWVWVKDGVLVLDLSAWDHGRGGPELRAGTEYGLRGRSLLVRTGYARSGSASRWCLGAGWRGKDIAADYGLALEAGGTARHQASLSYFLGPFSFQSDGVMPGSADPARIKELEERLDRLRQAQADLAKRADSTLAQSRKLAEKFTALQNQYVSLQAAAKRVRTASPAPVEKMKVVKDTQKKKENLDFLQGKELFEQERYLEAFEVFGRVFDRDPQDPPTRQYMLDCLQKIPKEELYPQEALDLFNQGIAFNTQGAFEEEIKIWQNFLSSYPKDLRVEGFLQEAEERLRRIKGGP